MTKNLTFKRKDGPIETLININRTEDNQRITIPKRFENPDKIYRINKKITKNCHHMVD